MLLNHRPALARYPLPDGVDSAAVVGVINDWEHSVQFVAPGAEGVFSATGNEVGSFRSFLYLIPDVIVVEEMVERTATGHTYRMVEGTSFGGLLLKSYQATMSVADGQLTVVADLVRGCLLACRASARAGCALRRVPLPCPWLPSSLKSCLHASSLCNLAMPPPPPHTHTHTHTHTPHTIRSAPPRWHWGPKKRERMNPLEPAARSTRLPVPRTRTGC